MVRRRLLTPFNVMLLIVAIYVADGGLQAYYGEYTSLAADLAYHVGFSLLMAWWVHGDRRKCGYAAPFEFEAFVLFAWPLVVPYYLFKTRGWRAAPASIAVAFVYLLPNLAAWAVVAS